MSAWDDLVSWVRGPAPVLPLPTEPTAPGSGPYRRPDGTWGYQRPEGPGGTVGTPGIAPDGGPPLSKLEQWWNDLLHGINPGGIFKGGPPAGPATVPGATGGKGFFPPITPAEREQTYADFWQRLGIVGESAGVYLLLLLLFAVGLWGLFGGGGVVGYVAAPRPFKKAPRPFKKAVTGGRAPARGRESRRQSRARAKKTLRRQEE